MTTPTYHVYDGLKQWATEKQKQYIDAVNTHKSVRKAAASLGIHNTVIQRSFVNLRKKAAICGYSPQHDMTKVVPDPFVVKGVSTYYDKDGKPKGQWVKSRLDRQRAEEAIRAAIEALADDTPRLPAVDGPLVTTESLCVLYTFTDCHIGMHAWGKQTGADWDLTIAERTLSDAFGHLVEAAPQADTCVVSQQGDFLHWDGLMPVTPTNRNVLDADGRFSKVVAVAVKVLRGIVDRALLKHRNVVLLVQEGNHDEASSIWLRHMFKLLYEREPRVSVIDSEVPYYVHQHGQTMLAFHHGHLKKNDHLPLLFAAQYPVVWGATTKRYCHTGHRHHVEEKEHSGMTVIQHPTLAARDAWAARGGWVAERQISAITYHSQFGQVARNTVTPEMLGV